MVKEFMSALTVATFTFLGVSALIGTDLFPEPVVAEWSDAATVSTIER